MSEGTYCGKWSIVSKIMFCVCQKCFRVTSHAISDALRAGDTSMISEKPEIRKTLCISSEVFVMEKPCLPMVLQHIRQILRKAEETYTTSARSKVSWTFPRLSLKLDTRCSKSRSISEQTVQSSRPENKQCNVLSISEKFMIPPVSILDSKSFV